MAFSWLEYPREILVVVQDWRLATLMLSVKNPAILKSFGHIRPYDKEQAEVASVMDVVELAESAFLDASLRSCSPADAVKVSAHVEQVGIGC